MMFFYRIFVALFTLGALLPQPGADARIAAISPIEGTLGVHNFSGLVKDINQINVEEVVAVGNVLPELEKVAALFFPDAEQLVYTMKQASNTSWYGEVENATGMANFNYIDGRLSGSATFNDTIFHIITRPLFDNSRAVDGLMTHATRLNINDLPEGQEPKCNGDCDQSNEVDVDTISDDPADYDTIDTMIVYTYQAMCAEASQEFPCEITPENKKPIEDRAALAVEEANTAYELSGVLGRQRLLHVEMVDETYMEKETFDEMLDDLSSTDDGVIDGVHALRDEYGADLVSMFVNNAVSCGLAWLFNTAPQNGFSVVCTDCSTGYYSYAHELAHNTGAHHDETNSQGTSGIFSFGYQDPESRFRTVMAYNCKPLPCLRIQRFSSANSTYDGIALGGETADNVRKLNLRWNAVAAFRNETNVSSPPTVAGETPPTAAPTSGTYGLHGHMLMTVAATLLVWIITHN